MPFLQQIETNQKILTSIKAKGLLPKQAVSIGTTRSEDHADILCFNVADLNKISDTKAMIESLTYESSAGLWSIAMEGAEVKSTDDKVKQELFNSAIQNSIVFIFKVARELEEKSFVKEICDDKITSATPTIDKSYFCELRTKSSIAIENVLAILVPVHLQSQIAKVFDRTPLIPVYDCVTMMKQYPFMLEVPDQEVSLASVTKFFANIDSHKKLNMQLIGADFADGLGKFIKDFPAQKKFGIHLTRLATPALCKTHTLSFETASVKGKEEKTASVLKIEYQNYAEQKEKLCIAKNRVPRVSEAQLKLIEANPAFAFTKDHTMENGYLVICHRQSVPLLKSIHEDPELQITRPTKKLGR